MYAFADICIYTFSIAVESSIVSHLPGALLDFIISIPYILLSTHEVLSRPRATVSACPAAPEPPPSPQPAPRPVPTPPEAPVPVAKENTSQYGPESILRLFDAEEFKDYEYYADLRKFYSNGYA